MGCGVSKGKRSNRPRLWSSARAPDRLQLLSQGAGASELPASSEAVVPGLHLPVPPWHFASPSPKIRMVDFPFEYQPFGFILGGSEKGVNNMGWLIFGLPLLPFQENTFYGWFLQEDPFACRLQKQQTKARWQPQFSEGI